MNQFQMLIRLRILTTCFDGLWDPQCKHRQPIECVISQVGSGCLKPLLVQATVFFIKYCQQPSALLHVTLTFNVGNL
jgi:hypothetical protein